MPNLLSAIVDRVLDVYENASTNVLEEARKALIDTIAVAAAAPGIDSFSRQAAHVLAGVEQGEGIVLGLWRRASTLGAARANAFLAHSLELDDWLAPGYTHAGAVVVPTLLAMTAGHGLELGDALRLMVAGYETALLVGGLLGRNHYRTWHTTATAGATAAATVATLAIGTSGESLAASLSLALTYMGGLWSINRSKALYKPLSPVHAVTLGITAASIGSLAKESIPNVLDDVCRAYRGECSIPDIREPAILMNGYKFYPSCRHSHTAVEAAERIHAMLGRVDYAEKIEVVVYEEAARVAGIREPQTLSQARFSLPLLVAAALIYGRLGIGELRRALSDPRVRRLARNIVVKVSDTYTSMYPKQQPATVVVHIGGGRYEETVMTPKGDPARRPSLDDIVGKALWLADEAGDNRARMVIEELARASYGKALSSIIEGALG